MTRFELEILWLLLALIVAEVHCQEFWLAFILLY